MEDTYLVEIRLGRTKWRVKEAVFAIAVTFGLEKYMEKHPHVTLFGPLILNEETSERQFLDALERIVSGYGPIPFTIDGYEKKEGMHGSVIAFSVRPSSELHSLTNRISSALTPVVHSLNVWDARPDKKWFHTTIANQLEARRALKVFSRIDPGHTGSDKTETGGFLFAFQSFLNRIFIRQTLPDRPFLLDETGLRVTVMKGEEILAEYDLPGKRWITGADIHDPACWQMTLKNFRREYGFELENASGSTEDEIFLMADSHFGHANIIRYCSRPFLFSDPGEMDRVLVQNWNSVVSPDNRVYFLGDLRYGRDAPPAGYYLGQLNGRITLIAGNHDEAIPEAVPSATLEHDGLRFLLVHDPAEAPPGFDGWIIHGHHHNNNLRDYPFISFSGKRINVSAEVIGYVPVSLNEICERIRSGQETGDQRPVLLRYPYVS